jgi:hypothetical protein
MQKSRNKKLTGKQPTCKPASPLTTVGSGCKVGDEDDDNSSKGALLELCLEEVLVAVVCGGRSTGAPAGPCKPGSLPWTKVGSGCKAVDEDDDASLEGAWVVFRLKKGIVVVVVVSGGSSTGHSKPAAVGSRSCCCGGGGGGPVVTTAAVGATAGGEAVVEGGGGDGFLLGGDGDDGCDLVTPPAEP